MKIPMLSKLYTRRIKSSHQSEKLNKNQITLSPPTPKCHQIQHGAKMHHVEKWQTLFNYHKH
jgi:hypothetical protein